jgi:hypothetical protein
MTMTNHRTEILDKVYSAETVEELEAGYDDWAKTYDED